MFSPKIVRAISETFLSKGWRFDTIATANLNGETDEYWIQTFAKAGGQAFISGDRAMLKRPALIQQISDLGIIGIYLPSAWAQSRGAEQMAYCIYWWAKIEDTLSQAPLGSIWLTPNGMQGGNLRRHVDTKAIKRAKQEANRTI